MTQNQIAYANYKEAKRHNVIFEKENQRHNLVSENQGWYDVGSRSKQAHASLVSAYSNAAYQRDSIPIMQQQANASMVQAEASATNAETEQGKVSVKLPGGVSFSGSITGLQNGVFQPVIDGITGAFSGGDKASRHSVTGGGRGNRPHETKPKAIVPKHGTKHR